jgi:NADPH2:quinone reductase
MVSSWRRKLAVVSQYVAPAQANAARPAVEARPRCEDDGRCSDASECALAKEHGAAHVINYSSEDFGARVKAITGGKGVKVIYDSIGKDTFERSLDCLRPLGLMASFGNASGPVPPFAIGMLGAKGSLHVTRGTLFTHIATREATQEMANDLFDIVGSGEVKIRIDQRYALADVAQAHTDLEARKTAGSSARIGQDDAGADYRQ